MKKRKNCLIIAEKKRHSLEKKEMEEKASILEKELRKEVNQLKTELYIKEESKKLEISVLEGKHKLALKNSRNEVKRLEIALQIKTSQEEIARGENLLNQINQTLIAYPLDQRARVRHRILSSVLQSRKERYFNGLMEQMHFRIALSKGENNGRT